MPYADTMTATPEPLQETVTVVPAPPGSRGIVCGVWRELRGQGELQSVVPANVYGCLNLVGAGTVRLDDGCALPPCFVTGPMNRPLGTWAQGPLHSASVVIDPWLLGAWCGLAPDALTDRWAPPGNEQLLRLRAQAARSPQALQQALQACAEQLPTPAPPVEVNALRQADSVGAAARELGVGERQFERRFRRVCGLSPRRWLALRAYETALLRVAAPGPALAAVALDSGFADQAHMNRRFVEVAARTPAQVRRALAAADPGHWPLRPAAPR